MDKIIANNSVNLCDRLANIIANTVTSECIKILGEIPDINKSDLVIDKIKREDSTVLHVGGLLGNKLNNPDIVIYYNDVISDEDINSINNLNDNAFYFYSLIRLLEKSKNYEDTEVWIWLNH